MKNNSNEWAKYSGLGIQMVASMLISLYIGKWIGGKLNMDQFGSLIGIFFGLSASLYNLIKQIQK